MAPALRLAPPITHSAAIRNQQFTHLLGLLSGAISHGVGRLHHLHREAGEALPHPRMVIQAQDKPALDPPQQRGQPGEFIPAEKLLPIDALAPQ